MANGFKSFDELYKEVIGKEPPKQEPSHSKKEGSVKMSHKKSNELLTDPSKGRKAYGSGKKTGYSKKQKQKKAAEQRKKDLAAIEKRRRLLLKEHEAQMEEKKAAADREDFIKSLKEMPDTMKCPKHGIRLNKGCEVQFPNFDEIKPLYFCDECGCFYYVSDIALTRKRALLRGIEVKRAPQTVKKQKSNSANNQTQKHSDKQPGIQIEKPLSIKDVEEQFDACCKLNSLKVMKTSDLGVSKCLSCGRDMTRSVKLDVLKVKFDDGRRSDVSGAYCRDCGTVSISLERLKSLTTSCRKHQTNIKAVSSRYVLDAFNSKITQAIESFDPRTTTLYVHQGKVRCLTENHNVISVALTIPSLIKSSSVVINANYCCDCDRFFISADEYEYYRSIHPIMLIKFEYVTDDSSDFGRNLADKSPLMLAGYTVRANSKYTDAQRQNILRNVIQLGILKKHEVINYLNYFISMNGKARGMEVAVAKWEADLEYVREHNFEIQKKAAADDIKRWR